MAGLPNSSNALQPCLRVGSPRRNSCCRCWLASGVRWSPCASKRWCHCAEEGASLSAEQRDALALPLDAWRLVYIDGRYHPRQPQAQQLLQMLAGLRRTLVALRFKKMVPLLQRRPASICSSCCAWGCRRASRRTGNTPRWTRYLTAASSPRRFGKPAIALLLQLFDEGEIPRLHNPPLIEHMDIVRADGGA
jgi:hypothetical protein